jgi:hypothetical protein
VVASFKELTGAVIIGHGLTDEHCLSVMDAPAP